MTTGKRTELERLYRVARQTLAMHTLLRDRYAFRVLILRCVLTAGSAIFCATAFAGDDLFNWFGLAPLSGRIVLRLLSLASFVVTLVMLVAGWDAASARHGEAVKRFTEVVTAFRRHRDAPESTEVPKPQELAQLYWRACHESVPIPNRHFASLKAQYLLNVTVSRVLDRAPGCPATLVRLILRMRGAGHGVTEARRIVLDEGATLSSNQKWTEPRGASGTIPDGERASR